MLHQFKLIILLLVVYVSTANAQIKLKTEVYEGVELLNVIHLLSDSVELVGSSYTTDVRKYFEKHKDHPAVQKARKLALINCDFPIRHAWCFYGFPDIKLQPPINLGAYNNYVSTEALTDYFRDCVDFYKQTGFHQFFTGYQHIYNQWINTFNQNLQEDSMLASIDSFYRYQPDRKVSFTLGAMNCNSFALPETGMMNPLFEGHSTIFMAYGNYGGKKDTMNLNFRLSRSSQMIWHELGHVYLAPLYKTYAREMENLAYILEQDKEMKQKAGSATWASYADENITQAITAWLRINTGRSTRENELVRMKDYYSLSPVIMDIIEERYLHDSRYTSFKMFFPVLLRELATRFPEGSF